MRILAAWALAVLMAGCSQTGRSSPDASDALLDAIQRTSEVDSFRVTIMGAHGGKTVAYYQAPDRLLTRRLPGRDEPHGNTSIIIGERFFVEDLDRPGYFQELPDEPSGTPPLPPGLPPTPPLEVSPPATPPGTLTPPVAPARAAAPQPGLNEVGSGAVNVTATASGFRFGMDFGSYTRGQATVRAGRITEITLFEKNERTWFVYDLFGRAPAVTAPPTDRLVPYDSPPPCDPSGNTTPDPDESCRSFIPDLVPEPS